MAGYVWPADLTQVAANASLGVGQTLLSPTVEQTTKAASYVEVTITVGGTLPTGNLVVELARVGIGGAVQTIADLPEAYTVPLRVSSTVRWMIDVAADECPRFAVRVRNDTNQTLNVAINLAQATQG